MLILGAGPIGLAVICALKARGQANIIVSEVSNTRKQFAKDFGADHVIDPSKEDVVARVREICNSMGVDVAFDCAGVQAGLKVAVRATKALGTIVNVAVWPHPPNIEVNEIVFKERHYMGIATYRAGDFQEVLNSISSGRMEPEKMITKKCLLKDVVEEGFGALEKDRDRLVKVLVEMNP